MLKLMDEKSFKLYFRLINKHISEKKHQYALEFCTIVQNFYQNLNLDGENDPKQKRI